MQTGYTGDHALIAASQSQRHQASHISSIQKNTPSTSPSLSTYKLTMILPTMDQPLPAPMVAVIALAISAVSLPSGSSNNGPTDQTGGQSQGGLSATPPTATTVVFDMEQYHPVEWNIIVPAATSSPTSLSPTTGNPTATQPATAQLVDPICVAVGLPCPNHSEKLCCSNVCVQDKETGGQFCGAVEEAPGATANNGNNNNDVDTANDNEEANVSWP